MPFLFQHSPTILLRSEHSPLNNQSVEYYRRTLDNEDLCSGVVGGSRLLAWFGLLSSISNYRCSSSYDSIADFRR